MEDPNTPLENPSDSDSSESWTIVDNNAPLMENQNHDVSSSSDVNSSERILKDPDEDTDGVAVITDDEEISCTQDVPTACDPPPVYQGDQFISLPPPEYGFYKKPVDCDASSSATYRDSEEELPSDFYISDRKIKSYVHKRNKDVSSLLNFVLVGAVIIATTLAIGFTWGINDTCSVDVLDSVSGILANLQKLQRENEMLKSKIRILRTMKHSKTEKDINFDKYLQYQMDLEQEKIIPKFDKNDLPTENIDHLENYQIIPDSPLIGKGTVATTNSKSHKDLESNNTNSYTMDITPEKVYNYKEYSVLNKEGKNHNRPRDEETRGNMEKSSEGGFVQYHIIEQRFRRETKINLDKHYPSRPSDIKSFCDDASTSNDKDYKKKCSLLNKHNNDAKKEAKKDKFKHKMQDKVKDEMYRTKDETITKLKMEFEENKKIKKNEKFIVNDKLKQKDRKNKMQEELNSDDYNIPENQEQHHSHYNDNVKADWYQKMYDGRKEIREKGFDQYDLLDVKNKAKWYFKRMSEREKNRWKGSDKFYKRKMRKEYLRSKF